MNTPEIVLHQWSISPFCVKVQKILDFKGLPYRVEEYGGFRALKVKRLSPSGKLPVLDYAGQRVADSSAIAHMLDALHPSPALFPASVDPHLVHLLEDWADESLYWFELWFRLFDEAALDRAVAIACAGRPGYERFLFKQGLARYRGTVVAQGLGRYPRDVILDNFRAHLSALAGRLARNPWLAGDAPSLADIAVSAQLDEIVRTSEYGREIDELPALGAWRRRCDFAPDSSAQEVPDTHVAPGRASTDHASNLHGNAAGSPRLPGAATTFDRRTELTRCKMRK
ncbi:MAG: hypothetical protein RL385_2692 [Pseudomonadota bacterium]|jgi:glutathione S-transferase